MKTVIETERLILRTWQDSDVKAFFRINQDPKVIEHLPGAMSIVQVNDFIARMNEQQQQRGYSLWAAELKTNAELIGFVGLNYTDWPSHFTPAVEIGWRLGSQYWGKGYATEGSKATLEHGFSSCNLQEIVSFTVPANTHSVAVMRRIGLKQDINGNFRHPKLPTDHALSKHVLYRLSVNEYKILEHLIRLEKSFIQPVDLTELEINEMIDERFIEVGASGRKYDKRHAVSTLIQRLVAPIDHSWHIDEPVYTTVGHDLFLFTYLLIQAHKPATRHTTLWQKCENQWKAIYHQGTVFSE